MQRWYQRFLSNISLVNEPRGNRPPVIDDDQMKTLIEPDPVKTTREVAEELSVDHSKAVQHLGI